MDLVNSMEMRWFLTEEDARVGLLNEWFANDNSEGPRADRYLPQTRDDLGVKLRLEASKPAKLELKYLLGAIGPTEVAPSVGCHIEHWQKLSVQIDLATTSSVETWFEVRKERKLRKFRFDHGRVSRVAATDRPAAGCNVELTKLVLPTPTRGQWTFGLEAFGSTGELLAIVQSAARELFAEKPALMLGPEHSSNYAEWVRRAFCA